MNTILSILLLGSRVVLASIIALAIQLYLLVRNSDYLLNIQQGMKDLATATFDRISVDPQYHVGYNLIGGDNIIVHTLFVLIAYLLILILLLPFKALISPKNRKHSTRRSRYS